jgi:hypothetical protein
VRWGGVGSKFCLCVLFSNCCLGEFGDLKRTMGGRRFGRVAVLIVSVV